MKPKLSRVIDDAGQTIGFVRRTHDSVAGVIFHAIDKSGVLVGAASSEMGALKRIGERADSLGRGR